MPLMLSQWGIGNGQQAQGVEYCNIDYLVLERMAWGAIASKHKA